MTRTKTFNYSIDINADAETVFNYMTHWAKQSEWVLFTDVSMTSKQPNQLGTTLSARTHVGPIGFTDTMIIKEWLPPNTCTVEHTGRVVRGIGIFTVEKLSDKKSKFTWQEITNVPFGAIGSGGLAIVKPFLGLLFKHSLTKMRDNIEKIKQPK